MRIGMIIPPTDWQAVLAFPAEEGWRAVATPIVCWARIERQEGGESLTSIEAMVVVPGTVSTAPVGALPEARELLSPGSSIEQRHHDAAAAYGARLDAAAA